MNIYAMLTGKRANEMIMKKTHTGHKKVAACEHPARIEDK